MTLKHIRTRFLIPEFLTIFLAACLVLSGCKDKTITHTVTFDSNGGSEVASQEIMDGKSAVEPKSPEKEGFTFTEWQLDDTAYDFSTPVTQDITLVASYTVNEGTEIILVTFDAANKAPAKEVEIIKGGTVTPPADPSRDGFEFVGWYLDGKEFDFSSPLSENVTLKAKWNKVETTEEAEGSEEESSKDSKPGAVGNKPGSSQEQQGGNTPTTPGSSSSATTSPSQKVDPEALTAQYFGKWYLEGYYDVFLDVHKFAYDNTGSMEIVATNYTLLYPFAPYPNPNSFVLYRDRYPNIDVYNDMTQIRYDNWDANLTKERITLGTNCIYINNAKFVRTPGPKDRYSDSCYRAALGTWYLKDFPKSIIQIGTERKADISGSDTFFIETSNFNIQTLATSGNSSYIGRADMQSEFDKYGISATNDVLTVSNQYGTKTFYKTPTGDTTDSDEIKLSLDQKNVTAYVGDTFTLQASIKPTTIPYSSLAWMSDDKSIASVDSAGNVTCRRAGTVEITVLTADYSFHASCKVTVQNRPVTSITISQTDATLIIGDSLQLTASANPSNATDRSITWSSSDASIAKVSGAGLVTAISPGNVTITATSYSNPTATASCQITITPIPISPLEAHAGLGVGVSGSGIGVNQYVYAGVVASGGSGSYSYQMNVYRDGALIGTFSSNHEQFYQYRSGTFHIEFTVTDSNGQSVSGRSSDFTLN